MNDDHKNNLPHSSPSEEVGTLPNTSEHFGSVPHRSEPFRTIPNASEVFRTLRNRVERTVGHTLTVKEVARMFEAAGVSRTERSIVKWCLPNKHDVARMDAFFDSNERKWFITQESVDLAIAEEKARADHRNDPVRNDSEPGDTVRNDSEPPRPESAEDAAESVTRVKELENQVLDLRILNGGKDFLIDQLRKERDAFAAERAGYVEKLMSFNRKVGELEATLLQLASGRPGKESSTGQPSDITGQA